MLDQPVLRPNLSRARRSRWAARLLAVLAAVLVLGACAPIVVTDGTTSGVVRVTAQSSGAIRVVSVPDERPREGVEVARGDGRSFEIPPGHYPPPGECRIWRPGVPPGQQEAPGRCSELERRVPPGAVLVRG